MIFSGSGGGGMRAERNILAGALLLMASGWIGWENFQSGRPPPHTFAR
jgi:hypothetical protein